MAKPLKSQWEFGELFPAEAIQRVLTVSELTGSIRRALEKAVGRVCVMGEMTNLRVQSSGHVYFTIKDANAQLACVLFRAEALSVNRAVLQDGQKVIVEGEITVYEARGQYQLRATSIQLHGVGALQAAFERLKLKLQGEGLFNQEHKRPLPRYPQCIGLITSPVGAAIRDVLHAIARRNPTLEIILAPCRVQGAGAAPEIAAGIHLLNDWVRGGEGKLDLILLTRGGGSMEDLWAFNEEIVARAIYASAIPIVSAVGHEIDFTIGDFVADLRAATPTAGAEIITEGVYAARPFLAEAPRHLLELVEHGIATRRETLRQQLRHLANRHPKRKIEEHAQQVDGLQNSLIRCVRHRFATSEARWQSLRQRLARVRPDLLLQRRKEKLSEVKERFRRSLLDAFASRRQRLSRAETRLSLLSPPNTLKRGYSITMNARTGQVIRAADQVKPGDFIKSIVQAGEFESIVKAAAPVTPAT